MQQVGRLLVGEEVPKPLFASKMRLIVVAVFAQTKSDADINLHHEKDQEHQLNAEAYLSRSLIG